MSSKLNFQEGSPRQLKCFACGARSIHLPFCNYSLPNGTLVELFKCSTCKSIQATDFTPPDYALEEDGEWATHYYCQLAAGLDFIIKPVFASQLSRIVNPQNFLDVGSGFGFAAHYAKTKGLRSLCIEPGEYGRIGSSALGLDLIDEYLTPSNASQLLSGEKFDLIYSSEVIEHIPDPASFIEAMLPALSQDGLILLTTPASNYVDYRGISEDSLDSNSLELIGFSQHCSIFSTQGMTTFMQNLGLSVKVISPAGGLKHRMVVVAGRNTEAVANVAECYESITESKEFESEYIKYLLELKSLKGGKFGISLSMGASFRLLSAYLNMQDLEAAKTEIEFLLAGERELDAKNITNHIKDVFLFFRGQHSLMTGDKTSALGLYEEALTNILANKKTAEFYSSSWSASILVPLVLAFSRTLIDLGEFNRARSTLARVISPGIESILVSHGRDVTRNERNEAILLDAVAQLNLNHPFLAASALLRIQFRKVDGGLRREALRLALVATRRGFSTK